MKRFILSLLLALLPLQAFAADAIIFEYDAGANQYARVYTGPTTAVAASLSAGTGGNTRLYYLPNSTLAGAGLSTPGIYAYTIFLGSTPSTSAADTAVGSGILRWNGTEALGPAAAGDAMALTSGERTTFADSVATASKAAMEQVGSTLYTLSQRALLALPAAGPGNPTGLPRVNDLPEGGGGGGLVIPVNQVVVPDSRRFVLEVIGTSLIAKLPKGIRVGEPAVFAIDFRNDLASNGRIVDLDAVEQASGPTDGMTWSLDDPEDAGIDKQSGILRLEASAAGTYELRVTVTRSPEAGGGQATGKITIVAVE